MIYDIAIIGAGCVGTAIAQRLSKHDLKIALLEKEADVSMGATKANSGIIHAPYMLHGKMKEEMNMKGWMMFEEVCAEIGVEFSRPGAVFCATNDEELHVLENELELCKKRGGFEVELIRDKTRIQEIEPQLNDNVFAVLYFPKAGIIIPFELAVGLAEHAVMNGVDLLLSYEVAFIKKQDDIFAIHSKEGDLIQAKTVVNAAGVYSDKIARMVGIEDFTIIPRRGEYILFDKNSLPLKTIIFPTPTLESKGIVISPTVHGNFFIGPNAHEIDSKEGNQTTVTGLNEILSGADKLIRKLPLRQNITNFAGIRATANEHDFIIKSTKIPQFLLAAGIDSPGLTSSLAIAQRIEELLQSDCGYSFKPNPNLVPKREKQVRLADLSSDELAEKISNNPQWGQMVCRCEQVTEAEIVEACHAPIPCTNSDMIKRRLRPGMGRCQGGFCLAKVMKIISREHAMIYEQVTKLGKGSQVVLGRTKNLSSEVFQGEKL